MKIASARRARAIFATRPFAAVLACVALCGASAPANAQALGRLFFTPQQRQDLDRRRETNAVEAQPAVVESLLTVNGHVVRSTGKTTTWVNGVAQHDAATGRNAAQPVITEGAASIRLKVGQ